MSLNIDFTGSFNAMDEAKGSEDINNLIMKDKTTLLDKDSPDIKCAHSRSSAALVNWISIDNRNIQYVSRYINLVLEYTQQEMLDPTFNYYDLIFPEDKQIVYNATSGFDFENLDFLELQPYRVHTKSARLRWVSEHVSVIRDAANKIIFFSSNIVDVTESKLSYEASEIEKKRLSDIIAGANIGTWEWNIQSGDIYVNERWAELIGYTLEEVSPTSIETWMRFTHPDDLRKTQDLLSAHFDRKTDFYEAEFRMKHKNGRWVWILDKGKVFIWDDFGKPVLMSGSHLDITDEKLAVDVLNQTRNNYQTFFNSINEFLFVLDEQGDILHINSTVVDRLGYSEKELLSHSFLKVYSSDKQYEVASVITNILNATVEDFLIPITTNTGTQVPVETKVTHGVWDGKNAFFVVAKDLTELNLSQEKFSKLFQLNPSACCLTDMETMTFVEVNDVFYSLFEFEKNEVLGKSALDLGILTYDMNEYIMKCLADYGKIMSFEADFKTKNGEVKHMMLSAEIIKIQNKDFRFTFVYDITKRKNAEMALNESQAQLTKYISHLHYTQEEEKSFIATKLHDEIGQVLVALKMDLGILKQKVKKDAQLSASEEVFYKFDQIYSLLGSSIQTTLKIMTDLRSDVLDLLGFVDAAKMYMSDFQVKNNILCRVENTVARDQISSIQAISLFRILQDALSNVADHSEADIVDVRINIEKNKLILEVEDNGKGFDIKKKINSNSYGILGIKERVRLLCGELQISSENEQGTLLRIELPIV